MLLCRLDGNWYLAQRTDPASPGVGLRVAPGMPHGQEFVQTSALSPLLFCSFHTTKGMEFFDDLRFKGFLVYPHGWQLDACDAVLEGWIDPNSSPTTRAEDAKAVLGLHGWGMNHDGYFQGRVRVDQLTMTPILPPAKRF